MKWLIITLCILFSHAIAGATPFLVCDPHPSEQQITGFVGILDGKPFQTPIQLHQTGAEIIYDLGTLNDNIHHFTEIRAVNIRGQSSPVPFDLPAVATSASHTRIAP